MSTNTALELTRHILRYGESRVAEVLGLSHVEIIRKVNNQNGFTIEQLGQVFQALKLRIVSADQVVIDRAELDALRRLAHKQLGEELAEADEAPKLRAVAGSRSADPP